MEGDSFSVLLAGTVIGVGEICSSAAKLAG